jgi:DMSO reductase anchor subunit
MPDHRSLVAFTLLVQSAVGAIWCTGVALACGADPHLYKWHALVAFVTVTAGMGFSLGHLGKPATCFYSVRNFTRSWLSREIATTVVFALVVSIMAGGAFGQGGMNPWIVYAASIAGGCVLYAMARAYRLRTVPAWDHGGTPLGFFGSALVLGGLQFDAISFFSGVAVTGAGVCLFGQGGLIFALIGFFMEFGAQRPNNLAARWRLLQGTGLALWTITTISEGTPAPRWVLFLSVAVLLVTGEVIQRNRFYTSYRSAGL